MNQFKLNFTNEYQDLKENQVTTTSSVTAEYQQDTVEALANLATATASDREAVTNLTSTNKAIMDKLATVNAKLITALKK